MEKTIAQLARENGMSPQAVYKRIKRIQTVENSDEPLPNDFEPIGNHVYKNSAGATVVDEEGQRILFGDEPTEDENYIELLVQQLQKKDEQIEALQNLLSQAHTLAQTTQIQALESSKKKRGFFNWFKRDE